MASVTGETPRRAPALAVGACALLAIAHAAGCTGEGVSPQRTDFAPPSGPMVTTTAAPPLPAASGVMAVPTEVFGNTDAIAAEALPPPPCVGDNDLLDPGLEEDAGLDQCKDDSDDDGCHDAFELYAGGCDDPGAILFDIRCFESTEPLLREYTLPDDRAFDEVTLRIPRLFIQDGAPREIELQVRPLSALRADAAVAGALSFTETRPGATLRFEIRSDVRFIPFESALLRSSAELIADGEVLSTHPIVMLIQARCPLVI